MLSSIHPLGERARSNRWHLTATAFAAGATSGGAAIGALAGSVGAAIYAAFDLPPGPVLVLAAACCLAGAGIDLAGDRLPLPSTRRQVDETWLGTYRGWVYGAGYGFQLGVGVATIVTTAAVYVMPALALLSGSPLVGALVGGTFGAVRGLSILAARHVVDPQQLVALHRSIASRAASMGAMAVGGQLASAAILLAAAA